PVLSELLPYFEKDEARHVGLGTQCLPILMRSMNRLQAMRLSLFALEITFWLLAANKAMEPALLRLGLDPRRVLWRANSKQMIVWEELWRATNKAGPNAGDAVARIMEAVASAAWPPPGESGVLARGRALLKGLREGVERVETTL